MTRVRGRQERDTLAGVSMANHLKVLAHPAHPMLVRFRLGLRRLGGVR
ncbi:hypothetical protein [Micromonospora sp. NPDC049679]